jgi:hypothetical protein
LDDSELEKWTAFVEKYLIFSLKQKGMEVNLIHGSDEAVFSPEAYLINIFVLTEASLSDPVYTDRIQKAKELKDPEKLVRVGLIKEMSVIESAEKNFPDLNLLKMFLIDTDTGTEVSQKDLWKKENFNSFLFKIYDLCSEIEGLLSSLSNDKEDKTAKAVYLADTTPDLISVREGIRRELIRQGFKVYPEKAVTGNGKEVEKAILDYLAKSVLSIHLFGKLYQEPKPGEVPRAELENKLTANFFSTKKETKKTPLPFKRIIWTPDNLVVAHEKQSAFLRDLFRDKKLYAGAEILTSSVEELKDFILEKLDQIDTTSGGNKGSNSGNEGKGTKSQKVFIVIKETGKTDKVKETLEFASHGSNLFLNVNYSSTLNRKALVSYTFKGNQPAALLNLRSALPTISRELIYKNYSKKKMAVKIYSKTGLKNLPF